MKVLIAGKGFIGTAIGEKLDEEVKYLDRNSAEYQQDVTEKFSIEEEFDVLYNTVGLPPGFATRKQYHEVHVKGTENLIEGVNTEKIVQVSAMESKAEHPFFQTKKRSEELVKDSEIEHTILRPSTVTGRGNKILEMMRKASVTRMFPRIPTKMQPIKIDDFADCAAKVADSREGEALNIGGPEKMTLTEIAEKVYSKEGRNCTVIPFPEEFLKDMAKLFGTINIPPLLSENEKLIGIDNTTRENHAPQLTQLQQPW